MALRLIFEPADALIALELAALEPFDVGVEVVL